MPPQSRGSTLASIHGHHRIQSRSTPDLKGLRTRHDAEPLPPVNTSPSEPASSEDLSLDGSVEQTQTLFQISDVEEDSTDESDDDEKSKHGTAENDDEPPKRPLYKHHSKSYTYLAPSTFAPPFYNRPPTPLPPSPSLTSLLRPNFSSTQNSRPNTPEPSSDEGNVSQHPHGSNANGSLTTASSSAVLTTTSHNNSFTRAVAKPIPRASPKVPTYEYYGFTLYLTSSLAFIVYVLWSFLPSPFLHQLGIYYYPNRWWALAIPAWTVMFILYIYVALALYNTGTLTLPLNSVEALVDEAANIAIVDAQGRIVSSEVSSWTTHAGSSVEAATSKRSSRGKGRNVGVSRSSSLTRIPPCIELDWRTLWNEGTDAVMDVPIGGICQILYGESDAEEDEDEDEGIVLRASGT